MRQLESLCGTFVKSPVQLRSILCDLKELNLITIQFFSTREQRKSAFDFQNMKQLKEEHIQLTFDKDKVINALQKENLSSINFKIDLNST